jgi:thiamine-monophosphate kinase
MYDEFELIEKIAAAFPTPEGLTLGIGDDCAILDPGRFDLVTTDTLVEGVHFRRDWMTPQDIGYKALAVSLSDIAAMGGGPGAFFLNLTLGPDDDKVFVDGLIEGMLEASQKLSPDGFEVSVGGGDLTRTSGPTVITITLMGEASPAGPVTRSGALPGDRIAVLGPVGLSEAGLRILRGDVDLDPADFPALIEAYRRPVPRVHEGALLGLFGVPSALIDVSDGLAQDMWHILKRSGMGASIETHNLPRHPELVKFCEQTGLDILDFLLAGGEDFELIVVSPPARMTKLWDLARRYGWDVYDIGEIRSSTEGLRILAPDGTPITRQFPGFRHF